MDSAERPRNSCETEPHGSELAGATQQGRVTARAEANAQSAPQQTPIVNGLGAKKRKASKDVVRIAGENSGLAAGTIGWNETIHQKIIGRTMAVAGGGLGRHGLIGMRMDREFALLNEPTRKIRGGAFLEPLIKDGEHLLAQIRCVCEAGKLIRLECIAGSGEKEFPRGLGAGLRHRNLQSGRLPEYRANNNHTVIERNSDALPASMWKAVEKKENFFGCCSACSGEYEDPDWTAWVPDSAEETPDTDDCAEFPEE